MGDSEFSRTIDVRVAEGKAANLIATPAECAALARRFDLVSISRLEADVLLTRKDRVVEATGTLSADIVQSCAISAEDLPVAVRETLTFRFVPESEQSADEVELEAGDCDEIAYAGSQFDLGEAVAQSLFLAIDPFAEGPGADAARRKAGLLGEGAAGPFAALAALKKP